MRDRVLELILTNHAGAMSHVTGLFARRAYNLVSILCAPIGTGDRSRVLLLVEDPGEVAQLMKQLGKLHDVHSVGRRDDLDRQVFQAMLPATEDEGAEHDGET